MVKITFGGKDLPFIPCFFSFISFIATIYVLYEDNTLGIGLLFLMPLAASIVYSLFSSTIKQTFKSIGCLVFYLITFLRYVLLPVLMVYTDYVGNNIYMQEYYYNVAVLVAIIELLVAFSSIRYYQRKYYYQYCIHHEELLQDSYQAQGVEYIKFSPLGMGLLAILIVLLVLRGRWNEIFSRVTFFVVKKGAESLPSTYDTVIFIAIKNLLFIYGSIYIYKKYQAASRVGRLVLVAINILIGFINAMVYVTGARVTVLEQCAVTIVVLVLLYPKWKNIFLVAGGLVALISVGSTVLLWNFNISFGESSLSGAIELRRVVTMLQDYFNGLTNIGWSFASFDLIKNQRSILMLFSEIVRYSFCFKIPGLTWVNDLFSNVKTSVELFTGTHSYLETAMIPIIGQCVYYVGPVFAILFDAIITFIMIKVLMKNYYIRNFTKCSIEKKYICIWLECMFGMFMCYGVSTYITKVSSVPLVMAIIIYANSLPVVLRKRN